MNSVAPLLVFNLIKKIDFKLFQKKPWASLKIFGLRQISYKSYFFKME